MIAAETQQLLEWLSRLDGREVNTQTVDAWQQRLERIPFEIVKKATASAVEKSRSKVLTVDHIVTEIQWQQSQTGKRARPAEPKRRAPKPDNFARMCEVANDPVAFAAEQARYNQQLIEAGFPPLYEVPEPRL